VALDRLFPPELGRLSQVGREVVDRDGRTLAMLPASGGVWRFATGVEDVSPAFLATLVHTEDRRFWWHPGIDPLALGRALLSDLAHGRVVSGGSTLTMQTARLLHPRRRDWPAKLIEMARAMQLEAHFSKRQILSMWLTLAPYGGNLEGVRAGALAWFGAPARALDPAQSALLVALPRRPEALRPNRHPGRATALRDRILRASGWPAAEADIPKVRLAMPRLGWPMLEALGHAPRIVTTLDQPLQAALERLAARALRTLPERASLAVVVADVPSRGILAMVSGSGRDASRAGDMDLTRAWRSPGSALKPFIYAMAFADGVAGPDTMVDDLPHRFGSYAPEDFDRGFAGNVTAAEALRRSLNVPAVTLLEQVGAIRFAAALKASGIALRLPPGADPSLPLALGGVGITVRELAALYAALASDGRVATLRLRADATAAANPLLTPNAAAMVADALMQRFPQGGAAGVAWKTGTSWGARDVWSAGFDARHVVVAWIGRPDGTPLPGATGRALALPVLAAVFGLLPPNPRPAPPPRAMPPRSLATSAPTDALRLLFPPPGAQLAAEDGAVVLRAMGGRRPLTFLVDGAPLSTAPARREAAWTPPSPGFYRLTVLDADGVSARAAVRVR